MVFNIPTSQQEVRDRAATDVQSALPTSNPFFKNSFLGAIITSFAGRVYDFYLQLNILINQVFVDTATGTFLERWGVYKNLTRNAATQSTGLVTTSGTNGSIIPLDTPLQNAEGLQYVTTATATINTSTLSVSSMTKSGSLVTVVTTGEHLFGSSQSATIAGANETEYNGSFVITVVDANTFTYPLTSTPASPATGTITASADIASLSVESVDFGQANNLGNGTQLTYSSPVVGVNDTAIVQFSEVSGGTDVETDPELRERIIDIYQNPISQFNENQIISTAKSVPGVTRVFVFESGEAYGDAVSVSSITQAGGIATVTTAAPHALENCMNVTIAGAVQTEYNITGRVIVISPTTFAMIVSAAAVSPATGTITMQASIPLGQVLVFFTRDNDASIIPSSSEVTTTKEALLLIKPANTADADLIVSAPTPVTTDFTFTLLSPDTSTMRAAVTANLEQLFQESTSVGQTLRQFSYESAIFQTVDPETGNVVINFTLSTPSGDVAVSANEIPVLGTISFI